MIINQYNLNKMSNTLNNYFIIKSFNNKVQSNSKASEKTKPG